jgi:hypothetical protein
VLAFMVMIRIIPKLAPVSVVRDHMREMGLVDQERAAEPAWHAADQGQAIDARFSVRE